MKNFGPLAVLAGCVTAFAGCVSTPAYVSDPTPALQLTHGVRSIPQVGIASTSETGDTMYAESQTTSSQEATVTLTQPATATMDLGHKLSVEAGRSGQLMNTMGRKAVCWQFVTTPGVGGPAHACLLDYSDANRFDYVMFRNRDRVFPLTRPVAYSVVKGAAIETSQESKFRRELLYQGLSKGTIKLSYREFANDMARPAFTQDVLYDLESNGKTTVVFKGLRVNVLEATSARIKYVVEQPFAK